MRLPNAVLLSMLLAAGCVDENTTPVDFTPSLERGLLAADDTAPPLSPMTSGTLRRAPSPSASTAPAVLPFTIVGDTSGVAGGGDAVATGMGSRVTLTLTAGRHGAHYSAAVHLGTCERPGPYLEMLNPVSSDSLGRGTAVSDLSIPIDSLAKPGHVIVLQEQGRQTACGPLTAEVGSGVAADTMPDPTDAGAGAGSNADSI